MKQREDLRTQREQVHDCARRVRECGDSCLGGLGRLERCRGFALQRLQVRIDKAVVSWRTHVADCMNRLVGGSADLRILHAPRVIEKTGACREKVDARVHHWIAESGAGPCGLLQDRYRAVGIEQPKGAREAHLGLHLSGGDASPRRERRCGLKRSGRFHHCPKRVLGIADPLENLNLEWRAAIGRKSWHKSDGVLEYVERIADGEAPRSIPGRFD
ncbi:MAG TPA: hypothetical protein VEN28_14315 [Burkholderiaceae bacterium]|nr:hypothetical protein [Burkholderiaceae bacterium]